MGFRSYIDIRGFGSVMRDPYGHLGYYPYGESNLKWVMLVGLLVVLAVVFL